MSFVDEESEEELLRQGYSRRVERERIYLDKTTGQRVNPKRPMYYVLISVGYLWASIVGLISLGILPPIPLDEALVEKLEPYLSICAVGAVFALLILPHCLPHRSSVRMVLGEEKVTWVRSVRYEDSESHSSSSEATDFGTTYGSAGGQNYDNPGDAQAADERHA